MKMKVISLVTGFVITGGQAFADPTLEQLAKQIKSLQYRQSTLDQRLKELETYNIALKEELVLIYSLLPENSVGWSDLANECGQCSTALSWAYGHEVWLMDHTLQLAIMSNDLYQIGMTVKDLKTWAEPLMTRLVFKIDPSSGVAGVVITANTLKVTAETTIDGIFNWISHKGPSSISHDISATFECLDDAYLKGQLCVEPQ